MGSQNDLGKVGLIENGLKELPRVAGAGVPLQEVWVSGVPIAPTAADAKVCSGLEGSTDGIA